MNRIKANLKTRMEQATLSDLPRIKGMNCKIKDFDPNPEIESWLLEPIEQGYDVTKIVPNKEGVSVNSELQASSPSLAIYGQ